MRTSSLIRVPAAAEMPWPPFPRPPALSTAIRWAVQDKQKFADLVQHLKDLNDDLEILTTELNVLQRQRDLVREQVGTIIDVEELETIEIARMGVRDPVADAASLRLSQIQDEHQLDAEPRERHDNNSIEAPSVAASADINHESWEFLDHPGSSNKMKVQEDVQYQVLHRVLCDSQPTATFFDEPSYQAASGTDRQWLVIDSYTPFRDPIPLHLSGKRPLHSIESYLEQNSHLAFLVFREYKCSHDMDTARTAESTESSIYLMSDALCSVLNSLDLEAEPPVFRPAMEFRSPNEWFYHNRLLVNRIISSNLGPCKIYLGLTQGRSWSQLPSILVMLLKCIQGCMAASYKQLDISLKHSKSVKWEHLPLIFPPGGVVIVPQFEDKLDRSTVQVRHDIRDQDTRNFYTLRSQLPNSGQEANISDFPIYPVGSAGAPIKQYLVDRGWRYTRMEHGVHLVTCDSKTSTDTEDISPLDHYIIDCDTYEALHQQPVSRTPRESRFHRDYDSDDLDSEFMANWEDKTDSVSESYKGDTVWEEHEALMDRDGISTCIGRFFACQPHVVYGFHLRKHVWEKLLVDNVKWVSRQWGQAQDAVLGDLKKEFLQRLLLGPMVVMTIRGPAASDAIDAISNLVHSPVYRIQISTESEAASAGRIFRQAESLPAKWRCIVVIEDLLGAYSSSDRPWGSLHVTVVAAALRFLDKFRGIVVFALPDDDWILDPKIEERVCARFSFADGQKNPTLDNRRGLWKQYVEEELRANRGRRVDPDPGAERALDGLAKHALSSDTIRSLVHAVTREDVSGVHIDFDLLLDLAERTATGSNIILNQIPKNNRRPIVTDW
ncbi:hypothetical protein N658DRAFT_31276 [Parathielavia hyrcaniae]|uniref:Prion-inhibition and propagation HeLo domain-containing protein n=1 Tax=Parathielavia hyrcaniae TaxID=113614 RepID=A0AAN6QAS3_9PEZI|nr:hypothetical protein N658DRAFT_31276 [Parathielavia hyrcaniae]